MSFIYLDYAAATPLDDAVLAVMQPYLSDKFFNPSATYLAAKEVKQALNQARSDIAHWLGVKSDELIFAAGGTEANNLAIKGIMSLHEKANVVVSTIEHESVLAPAKTYDLKLAPVGADGRLKLDSLASLIDEHTVLVSICYANNEIGTIQALSKVSQLLSQVKSSRALSGNNLPIYLHTDACQAPAYLSLQTARLGVDLMTLNGGKIYGPKQSGALFIKGGVELAPQILGGGQERNLRSGTENVASIIGFAQAMQLVQERRINESARLSDLRDYFLDQLLKKFPEAKSNGSAEYRLPNNINVCIEGQDNETLLMKLDEMGIACASGSACNANKDSLSSTLLAIGLSEQQVRSSLRFTMGKSTTKAQIDQTLSALTKSLG